jgi:hypothetical protein
MTEQNETGQEVPQTEWRVLFKQAPWRLKLVMLVIRLGDMLRGLRVLR